MKKEWSTSEKPVVIVRIWPNGPITVHKLIVSACSMQFKNLEPGFNFWSKLKLEKGPERVCVL